MKKIIISSLVVSLLLVGATNANSTQTSKEVSTKAASKAVDDAKDKYSKLVDEALHSLELSARALSKLNENKPNEAIKDIELALGKLEAILSTKDTPKFLPIKNNVIVKNFIGSAKDVEVALTKVKKLLSDGKVQEAGELLTSLQSEINVIITGLPLRTYPDALRLASKYILEDKPNRAKEVLRLALNTFSEVHEIIPIPLVNTIGLVESASDIAKENKEKALRYLESANDELNKAEKLGYISQSETTYEQLYNLIKGIEKEVKGPNKAEKLFKEFSDIINEFKDKIFSSHDKE